jgi:hypothetical protein
MKPSYGGKEIALIRDSEWRMLPPRLSIGRNLRVDLKRSRSPAQVVGRTRVDSAAASLKL